METEQFKIKIHSHVQSEILFLFNIILLKWYFIYYLCKGISNMFGLMVCVQKIEGLVSSLAGRCIRRVFHSFRGIRLNIGTIG